MQKNNKNILSPTNVPRARLGCNSPGSKSHTSTSSMNKLMLGSELFSKG